MYAGTDGYDFARYLWRRRGVVIVACASALTLTGSISPFLPHHYTATASVLIQPPGGNDPRSSTAISTVYLDSLKTYERLAASDSLFARALDDLHLRRQFPDSTIESLKRRMLTISKPANTTILDVSATLDDPQAAQALAQYIAEKTVELSSSLDQSTDREMLEEPQRMHEAAIKRREAAEKAKQTFTQTHPREAIEKELQNAADLRTEIGKDLARARAELANYVGQAGAPRPPGGSEELRADGWTEFQISATRARIAELEAQDGRLLNFLNEKSPALENLKRTEETLDAELRAARSEEEALKSKLNDIRASAAFRGIRLKLVDPGIVPQRASFPNTPLNLAVAFVLSAFGSCVYLAVRLAVERHAIDQPEKAHRYASEVFR